MVKLDFICNRDGCEHIERDVLSTNGKPVTPLEHCGQPMTVYWMTLPQSVQEFTPFTTRNIHPDGKPLLVRNKGDLQRYYREYGVVHYDDPNLVAQGNEIVRRGKWNPSAFVDMGRK
jgi:hypothetical protein